MNIRLFVISIIFCYVIANQEVYALSQFLCQLKIALLDNISHVIDNIISGTQKNGGVKFFLYTTKDNVQIDKNEFSSSSVNGTFDPSIDTVVLIHGFLNTHETEWIQELQKHLLMREKINVIAVDWWNAMHYNYGHSAAKVFHVAKKVSEFLQNLSLKLKTSLKDWHHIHLIGHSLGAHIAGQAATNLLNDVHIHRVTGLDPAKPYFDKDGEQLKLNKWCAQFVDVIHSNANHDEATLGMYEPLGHIDFYPNGGDYQPDCFGSGRTFHDDDVSKCISKLLLGIDVTSLSINIISRFYTGGDMICNHGMAPIYYIDTLGTEKIYTAFKTEYPINNDEYKCYQVNCSTTRCVEMGINAEKYNSPEYYGVYYVQLGKQHC